MAVAPPLRWNADGWARSLASVEAWARRLTVEPTAPTLDLPSGWSAVKDRPMRIVLRGPLDGPDGPAAVVAKVRRPATRLDRVRRHWERPKGPAEGLLLRALASAGLPVPHVLAWSAEPGGDLDLLLLREVEDAVPLSERLAATSEGGASVTRDLAERVGALLRRGHDAGWSDRDLHRGNLLVVPGGLVLLDPGTSSLGPSLSPPRRVAALASAAHGLGADPRCGLRALRAYFGGDRDAARRWFPLVSRAQGTVARAYRRGRARRATRNGRHFEAWGPVGESGEAIRSIDKTPTSWKGLVPTLLAGAWPPGRALKADGSVVAIHLPGREDEVVVKRFAKTWRDRLRVSRSLRAFRRAYALRVRGVSCPEPLLAAAGPGGDGVYVAALAGPRGSSTLDLEQATRPDERGLSPFARASRVERVEALHRLGRYLRRLHDADVTHRDLKAPNLVAWRGSRGVGFSVVDLEGARVWRRPLPWARRARDLARLDASVGSPPVSRTDRRRVLEGYYAAFEAPRMPLSELARRVARHSAAKRGPAGVPR